MNAPTPNNTDLLSLFWENAKASEILIAQYTGEKWISISYDEYVHGGNCSELSIAYWMLNIDREQSILTAGDDLPEEIAAFFMLQAIENRKMRPFVKPLPGLIDIAEYARTAINRYIAAADNDPGIVQTCPMVYASIVLRHFNWHRAIRQKNLTLMVTPE